MHEIASAAEKLIFLKRSDDEEKKNWNERLLRSIIALIADD